MSLLKDLGLSEDDALIKISEQKQELSKLKKQLEIAKGALEQCRTYSACEEEIEMTVAKALEQIEKMEDGLIHLIH